MKKRLLSLVLVLIMVCSILSFPASAAEIVDSGSCGKNGDNVTWTLDSNGVLKISGSGEMHDYEFGNDIEKEPGEPIDSAPYLDYSRLIKSVVIEPGVTDIGNAAFMSCGMVSVSISKGVTSIGNGAFFGCSDLTSIQTPDTLSYIGESAFEYCEGLTSVTILRSIISIGINAFKHCSHLTDIYYSGSKEDWNRSFISNCYSDLLNVTIHYNYSEHTHNLNAVAEVAPTCTETGTEGYWFCRDCGKMFSDPEGMNEISAPAIKAIGHAWGEWSVVRPATDSEPGVKSRTCSVCGEIETRDVSMLAITLQPMDYTGALNSTARFSVEAKGTGTLHYQWEVSTNGGKTWSKSSVTSAEYSTILINKNDFCMVRCIVSDDYGNSVTSDAATMRIVYSGELTPTITWILDSNGVLTISGSGRMYSHNLDFYNYDEDDVPIKVEAYLDHYLKIDSVVIKPGVTSIGDYAFNYCYCMESVSIPKGITDIGNYAFWCCEYLSSIQIPDTVTYIGESAFKACWGLTSVTIPNSVSNIDKEAFYGCTSLTDVYYVGTESQWNQITIGEGNHPLLNATIHFVSPLSITTQPVDYSGAVNTQAVFTVAAKGTGTLHYQWEVSTNGGRTWSKSSVTSAVYAAKLTAEKNNRMVRCVVTDASGKSITSEAATMHIRQPLTITTQPVDYTGAVNSQAVFTVAAKGTGTLHYQWEVSTNGGRTWSKSSVTSARYSAKLTAEKDGRMVRCVVTDDYGNTVTSDAATMHIQQPLTITAYPDDYTGAVDSTARFTVAAVGTGTLHYQWQVSTNGGRTWSNSSIKSAVYVTKLTAEKDGRMVRCIVSDDNDSVITSTATMRIQKQLAITQQPVDYNGALNSQAVFTVAAKGTGTLHYQWQVSTNGGKTWSKSSVTSARYSAKLTSDKDGRMVRCIVTDDNGSVTSQAATMHISTLSITKQPVDYKGALNSTARFTVVATGEGLSYQWQVSTNGGRTWSQSSVKSAVYAAKLTSEKNGRMVRCIVTDANGKSVTSSPATMRIG